MVGSNLRPQPPTPEAIIQDIINAPSGDPVFRRLSDATGNVLRRYTEPNAKDVRESNSHELMDLDESYQKVRGLLDNLSSLQTGKDRLKKGIDELLASKEDVSAMSLELKTRLEHHKSANRSTRDNQ